MGNLMSQIIWCFTSIGYVKIGSQLCARTIVGPICDLLLNLIQSFRLPFLHLQIKRHCLNHDFAPFGKKLPPFATLILASAPCHPVRGTHFPQSSLLTSLLSSFFGSIRMQGPIDTQYLRYQQLRHKQSYPSQYCQSIRGRVHR